MAQILANIGRSIESRSSCTPFRPMSDFWRKLPDPVLAELALCGNAEVVVIFVNGILGDENQTVQQSLLEGWLSTMGVPSKIHNFLHLFNDTLSKDAVLNVLLKFMGDAWKKLKKAIGTGGALVITGGLAILAILAMLFKTARETLSMIFGFVKDCIIAIYQVVKGTVVELVDLLWKLLVVDETSNDAVVLQLQCEAQKAADKLVRELDLPSLVDRKIILLGHSHGALVVKEMATMLSQMSCLGLLEVTCSITFGSPLPIWGEDPRPTFHDVVDPADPICYLGRDGEGPQLTENHPNHVFDHYMGND